MLRMQSFLGKIHTHIHTNTHTHTHSHTLTHTHTHTHIYIYIYIYKMMTSRRWPEGSLFKSFKTGVSGWVQLLSFDCSTYLWSVLYTECFESFLCLNLELNPCLLDHCRYTHIHTHTHTYIYNNMNYYRNK